MPTPAEQKALLFLGAVALMGGAVRLLGGGTAAEATAADREGLAAQIVAVEGAAAAARAERSGGKARKSPRGKRKQPATGGGSGAADSARGTESRPGAIRRPLATPVDVDRATVAELQELPGIGPSLAARIVADRNANGPFGTLAALDGVSGVGPTLINKLGPHVTFSGPPRPSRANGSGGGARLSGRVVGLIGGAP
jgi:competence protein ComEA